MALFSRLFMKHRATCRPTISSCRRRKPGISSSLGRNHQTISIRICSQSYTVASVLLPFPKASSRSLPHDEHSKSFMDHGSKDIIDSTVRWTMLLPEEVKAILPPLYAQEYEEDPMVYIKFSFPIPNGWIWYAYEGSQREDDFIFFG